MTLHDLLSLVIGVVEIALAAVVLRQLARFGRAFPWLAALMIFFAIRGLDRVYVAFFQDEPAALEFVLDTTLLLVLVLLVVGMERMVEALRSAQEEAQYREEEYARALADYRTLVRHRLANPIAAIRGGLVTLREIGDLGPEQVRELLDMIEHESRRLESLALAPSTLSEEERLLSPQPRL